VHPVGFRARLSHSGGSAASTVGLTSPERLGVAPRSTIAHISFGAVGTAVLTAPARNAVDDETSRKSAKAIGSDCRQSDRVGANGLPSSPGASASRRAWMPCPDSPQDARISSSSLRPPRHEPLRFVPAVSGG
jgi:hypothetical protein